MNIHFPQTRIFAILLVSLLFSAVATPNPGIAKTGNELNYLLATTCDPAGDINYHAYGYTTPGGGFYGGTAKFPERTYTASDWASGGFVLNALWNEHGGGYWSEVGFTKGWQGQNIYAFYVAYNRPTYGYNEWKLTKTPGGTGTQHTYTIDVSSISNTVWHLRIDSNSTYFVDMYLQTSYDLLVGGEQTSSSSTMGSTTSSTLKYYTQRDRQGATNWPNDPSKTGCRTLSPMHWDWTTFPTTGRAWSP
jgi:hypothetical protein